MAPFSLMTAGVSWLAKSFSVLSCTSSLARCTSVLPATYINPVRCLCVQPSPPPKRPLNGYLRYFMQQKPLVSRNNPDYKLGDVTKMIAREWRAMGTEQKRPFEEAALRAREQFKVEVKKYEATLTSGQLLQQTLEKKRRIAKRKAIRKKRELNTLGKPKGTRAPFNIYWAEHFEEAQGTTMQAKMIFLSEVWKKMTSQQKQVYYQLAEDDQIRYKNEMKVWEQHMMEIGRPDLIRASTKKRPGVKTAAATKATKKVTATGKSKTTKKKTKSSSEKTVRTTNKR
ncbi:transcription factor A, mitochondrial [Centropristis striata]|uniref:transcription factor A, mitochondrial n=1 Tax=Centropristis striata TaxID=184440 RepID=UPI0027DF3BDC|nr:transcription factor A, mitochondrial [Centropristis striata]